MSTFSKLWIRLRDRAYRHSFVATQLKRGIPFQFRAMRKKLGLSQADLAQLAGVSQGVISRAEDPDYGNLTFNTVLRIAKGMDCAFVGRIVPFSDLAKWFDNLSENSVQVPTFDEEDRAFEGLGTTVDYVYLNAPVQQLTQQVTIGGWRIMPSMTMPMTAIGHLEGFQGVPGLVFGALYATTWTTVRVPPALISSPASTDARAANSRLALAA